MARSRARHEPDSEPSPSTDRAAAIACTAEVIIPSPVISFASSGPAPAAAPSAATGSMDSPGANEDAAGWAASKWSSEADAGSLRDGDSAGRGEGGLHTHPRQCREPGTARFQRTAGRRGETLMRYTAAVTAAGTSEQPVTQRLLAQRSSWLRHSPAAASGSRHSQLWTSKMCHSSSCWTCPCQQLCACPAFRKSA
eukprot:scaffold32213_cov101-Isochrysis_galbana.AAC.1